VWDVRLTRPRNSYSSVSTVLLSQECAAGGLPRGGHYETQHSRLHTFEAAGLGLASYTTRGVAMETILQDVQNKLS